MDYDINNLIEQDALEKVKKIGIKKVYLHMGMDKTATSSIQATLRRSFDYMQQHDMFYLFRQEKRRQDFGFNIFRNKDKRQIVKMLMDEIAHCTAHTLLYSNELLSYFSLEHHEFLYSLFKALGEDVDIKIIYSTREKASFYVSGIQQRLKFFDDNENGFYELYSNRLERIEDIYGKDNIIIYKFEDALKHRLGPVGQFIEQLGFDDEHIKQFNIVKTNESASAASIEVFKYFIKRMNENSNLDKLRFSADIRHLIKIRGDKFRIETHKIKKVLDQGKKDTLWLKDNYGIDYTNAPFNFEEPKKVVYDEKFYEDVAAIYDDLSVSAKIILHDFVKEKRRESDSQQQKKLLRRLNQWIGAYQRENYNKSSVSDIEEQYLKEGAKLADFANIKIEKVILHIGMHKTATSSIQASMYGSKKQLYKKGIYYTENRKAANAFTLFGLFVERPDQDGYHRERASTPEEIHAYNKDNLHKLLAEIKTTEAKVFVISEEHLCGIKSQEKVSDMKAFLNLLMPNANVTVVHCLRGPISFATSSIQQRIGGNLMLLPEKNTEFKFYRDFKGVVQCYLEVFGRDNIIVYKFEDALKHKFGPVGYFMHMILGLPLKFISRHIKLNRVNEARSYKALEIISFINQRSPYYIRGAKSKQRTLHDCHPIMRHVKGDKFKLSREQQQIVYDTSIDQMMWFKEVFGIDYTQPNFQDHHINEVYDKKYAEQIMALVPHTTPFISRMILEFVKHKALQVDDKMSRDCLNQLIVTLSSKVSKENDNVISSNELAQWFLEIMQKEKNLGVPQVYRNIALFCERHGQIASAYEFMKIAKEHAGDRAPLIHKKCDEYLEHLKK